MTVSDSQRTVPAHIRDRIGEAVRLRESGMVIEAVAVLTAVYNGGERSPELVATLADLLWDVGSLELAIGKFMEAVALAPDSEPISLGLFHCLMKAERTDEAFSEMRRFLSTSDSLEYRRLLRDINRA